MVAIPMPHVVDDVAEIVEDEGTMRFSELAEEVDVRTDALRISLMQLAERGDVAVFPVGDSVQIRSER